MTPPEQAMAARLKAIREDQGRCDYCQPDVDTLLAHVETLTQQVADWAAVNEVIRQDFEDAKEENARLTAECKRLDNAVAEVWDNVHRVVQQAWVKPHDYDDSPLDLIAAVIDERDEAEQENARLTADRDEWMASSAGYGSDMLDQKVRAEQAEQARDAAHAALREIADEHCTCTGYYKCNGCVDRCANKADAALAASAPQKGEA